MADRVTTVLFAAAAALLSTAVAIRFFNWDFDDTFIIYRYAEHILSGVGWRYNPGESYNASTSVLNTAIISAVSLATKDPRATAHVLDAVWIFTAGAVVFMIFKARFGAAYASVASLLLVAALGHDNTLGLEIHLFLALALLFVYLELRGIGTWALLGALVLARPDGVLLLAAKAGVTWTRQKRFPWSGIATSALVLAPWVAFSLYNFHQVLPATLRQKMWQGRSGYWGHGLVYLHGLLRFFFHKALEWKWWAGAAAVMAYPGVRSIITERLPLLYLVGFVAAQQTAYVLLNVAFYQWYAAVFYATALICSLYGIGLALLRVERLLMEKYDGLARAFKPGVANVAVGLCVLVFTAIASVHMMHTPWFYGDAESYRKIAHEINQNAPPGALASAEVGVLGYYTKREMLDIVGLTSNRGEFITGRNNNTFYEILPSVVVLHYPLREYETAVRRDPRFARNYVRGGSVDREENERLEYYILKART